MAQKLSVQIELEGAKEIARQLENLGDTGKKAFEEMGAAAEKVGGFSQLDPTDVTKKLEEMGITGVDAINQIQEAVTEAGKLEGLVQGVKQLENGFGALGKVLRPISSEIRKVQQTAAALYAVVGPFGVAGVAAFAAFSTGITAAAKATIGFADSINKVNTTAITLGVGVDQLDRFRAGLEQAGVSAESVGQILQSKLASEQGLQGLEAFIQSLERMPDSAARSKAAVEQFGAAGAELIRILQAGGRLTGFGGTQGLINADDARKATELGQAINQLGAAIGRLNTLGFAPALTVGINATTVAVQTLGGSLERTPWMTVATGIQLIVSPLQGLANVAILAAMNMLGIGTAAQTAGQQAQQGVQMWTQWGTAATQAGNQAKVAVDGAVQAAQQPIPTQSWMAWATSAATAVDTILAKLRELLGLSQNAAPLAGGAPIGGSGGGIGSAAGGGLLGGSGTGTSDSNLAWVSRGEYVTPAHAVRQPGVLAFLEALRRSGGNLSRALDGMGRFALGGLVPRAIPAFAAGGLNGGNNVTIQFPGLPAIGGLRASSGVVEQLQKAAALAQVRSGGRKPSRYS